MQTIGLVKINSLRKYETAAGGVAIFPHYKPVSFMRDVDSSCKDLQQASNRLIKLHDPDQILLCRI